MRIGVLGGTFDPIHWGHLMIAEVACARLGLQEMVFVPAGQPPHKLGRQITGPEQRLEMVELATAGNPLFAISRVDVDRMGPCYTVDTIRLLRDAWGVEADIFFLIGADSLVELPTWHRPDLLMRLCHVVVLGRPGYPVDWDELDRLLPGAAVLIKMLDTPVLDVSSTDIKQRVRQGLSIHHLVPPSIERYIYEHGLYRACANALAGRGSNASIDF